MLHIHHLSLRNFATHHVTDLDLPTKGLLAITGSNGAGKSTILECVAAALWGESLRGEMGWVDGKNSAVIAITDGLTVTREKGKSSPKLKWMAAKGGTPTYETSAKAQDALDAVIGSYDVWRRTCVLSSLDSAAFSLARDSDRKRLLEEFLGLGMFDAALDACRKDRRTAAAAAQAHEQACKNANLQLSFAQQQYDKAVKTKETLLSSTGGKDAATLKSEGVRLAEMVKAAKADLDAVQGRIASIDATIAHDKGILAADAARLAKLGADKCGTCGQSVTDLRSHLKEEADKLAGQKQKHLAKLQEERAEEQEGLADLQEEHQRLSAKLESLRSDFRLAESLTKQRTQVDLDLAEAQKALDHWTAEKDRLDKGAEEASLAAHLEPVEQVLGLRGVRAQVLAHALSALERQANAWLSRMPTEQGVLDLSLSGSTTQKSGSVVDAIALKVRGRSYAACSGGERRRVDVAILLALRELAVAAHGRDGTLFCDEVFDALDVQGQADVSSALREMAQDRLVVVITHSPDMLNALRPDARLHVSLVNGVASVRKP